jgi:hypothetical protein
MTIVNAIKLINESCQNPTSVSFFSWNPNEKATSAISKQDAKEIVQQIPTIQFVYNGTECILRRSIKDPASAISQKLSQKDYLPTSVERKKFNAVLKKVAEVVGPSFCPANPSKPNLLHGTTWNHKDALLVNHQSHSELAKIIGDDCTSYITPDSVLLMGPLLGKGVTREVRVCAEITSGKIRLLAANLLRSEHMSQASRSHTKSTHKLPQTIFEQLRTFQMQERLQQIEPSLPSVIPTLHWMRSDASLHHVDTVCVLTELLHGSLGDCVKALSPIPGLDFIFKFRSLQQVSKQLEILHQNGIVHRDIHDNNVLVSLENVSSTGKLVDVKLRATLCDFETVGPVISENRKAEGSLETSLSEIGFLKNAPRADGPLHPP